MGKPLKNSDVRAYAALNCVTIESIAKNLSIAQPRVSERLSWELADSEKDNLYRVIDEIVKERGDEPKRLQRV